MTPAKEREFLAGLSYTLFNLYDYVKKYHYGKQNAITLPELFRKLDEEHPVLEGVIDSADDLRRLCAEMPFCSCGRGVFYPATAEEERKFIQWLESRSLSLFCRTKRHKYWHADLLDGRQMSLFGG